MHWISVKFYEMGDIPEPLAGHVVHLLRQPVVVLNTNIVNDSIQSSKYSTPLEEPGEISQIYMYNPESYYMNFNQNKSYPYMP